MANNNNNGFIHINDRDLQRQIRDITRKLRLVEDHVKVEVNKGLIRFAEHLLTEALKITPIYQRQNDPHNRNINTSGHLRGSGSVKNNLNSNSSLISNQNGQLQTRSFNSLPQSVQSQVLELFVVFSAVYAQYQHHGLTKSGRPFNYTEPRAKREFLK